MEASRFQIIWTRCVGKQPIFFQAIMTYHSIVSLHTQKWTMLIDEGNWWELRYQF